MDEYKLAKSYINGSRRFEGYFKTYQEFLNSDFWKKIKTRFFTKKTTIKVCFICASNKDLQLHHRNYKKVRNNTINNLICLCRKCHHNIHFRNGIKVSPPVSLIAYIQLSVEYMREAGLYPTHLLKYKYELLKFAK